MALTQNFNSVFISLCNLSNQRMYEMIIYLISTLQHMLSSALLLNTPQWLCRNPVWFSINTLAWFPGWCWNKDQVSL